MEIRGDCVSDVSEMKPPESGSQSREKQERKFETTQRLTAEDRRDGQLNSSYVLFLESHSIFSTVCQHVSINGRPGSSAWAAGLSVGSTSCSCSLFFPPCSAWVSATLCQPRPTLLNTNCCLCIAATPPCLFSVSVRVSWARVCCVLCV